MIESTYRYREQKPATVLRPRVKLLICDHCREQVETTSAVQRYCKARACQDARDRAAHERRTRALLKRKAVSK